MKVLVTGANGLASTIWAAVEKGVSGVHHCSDYVVASWYDFATAIYEEGTTLGLLNSECAIKPIRTDQYPVKAIRPQYSVMVKSDTVLRFGREPGYWRVELRRMIEELVNSRSKK